MAPMEDTMDLLHELEFLNDQPDMKGNIIGQTGNMGQPWSMQGGQVGPLGGVKREVSAPSPIQQALQGYPGSMKRPSHQLQRSSSISSFDTSQKSPGFAPSPQGGPRSAGFPNQR